MEEDIDLCISCGGDEIEEEKMFDFYCSGKFVLLKTCTVCLASWLCDTEQPTTH